MKRVITLDGPAGSGKSTIAKLVSEKLNYFQIDSGAFYRTYTYIALEYAKEKSINFPDFINEKSFQIYLENIFLEIKFENKKQIIFFNNKNIESKIRNPQITQSIKFIADNRFIRELVNQQIRKISENYDIIADGRDMGTVVFPNAELKIFITASLEVRAKRRFKEFQEKFTDITIEEVQEQIKKRDFQDENREFGALKASEDAIMVDTSKKNLKVSLEVIEKIINSTF